MYDEIVHLKVGPDSIDFAIHKGLLCHHSSYFAAALNGSFKEANEKVIHLTEESPETIKHFNLWLYTQTLLETGQNEAELDEMEVAALYIFAEKRDITKLQDAAIDAIIGFNILNNTVPISCMRLIYKNTPESAPMRRLLIDLCVSQGHEEYLQAPYRKSFPHDALVDLGLAFYQWMKRRRVPSSYDFKGRRCAYHCHPKDEKCP